MNRLKGSSTCRLCRRWLQDGWSSADAAGRASIERQMDNGLCDGCQLERQSAAVAYIAATDRVRLYQQLALIAPGRGFEDHLSFLRRVVDTAELRCHRLHMWPFHRDPQQPERFRNAPKVIPPWKRRKHGHHHSDH